MGLKTANQRNWTKRLMPTCASYGIWLLTKYTVVLQSPPSGSNRLDICQHYILPIIRPFMLCKPDIVPLLLVEKIFTFRRKFRNLIMIDNPAFRIHSPPLDCSNSTISGSCAICRRRRKPSWYFSLGNTSDEQATLNGICLCCNFLLKSFPLKPFWTLDFLYNLNWRRYPLYEWLFRNCSPEY